MEHVLTNASLAQGAVAVATSHAGEILQGAVRSGNRTRRLLLSLPAPALWTYAEIMETPGHPLTVEPAWAHKAYRAAKQLLEQLEVEPPEVVIRLTTNIPIGKGCGSSTADILATVRALLLYMRATVTEENIARLIVDVEEASDSSILSRPALFRHREGTVEEYLPGPFPEMRVVVIDAQPTDRINTISLPRATYSDAQLTDFELLIAELRQAFRERNPWRLGAVATASARISQRFLPKPHFELLVDLVTEAGGYGVSVSHSGTVVSALLPVNCAMEKELGFKKAIVRLGMRLVTQYSLNAAHAVAMSPA